MACRPIMQRGILQHDSCFSNPLILAAVCTECTTAIRCWKRLVDRLARVDWLPEGKGRFWQLSVACQDLPCVLVSTKLRRKTSSPHGRWQPRRRRTFQSGMEAGRRHRAEGRGRGSQKTVRHETDVAEC